MYSHNSQGFFPYLNCSEVNLEVQTKCLFVISWRGKRKQQVVLKHKQTTQLGKAPGIDMPNSCLTCVPVQTYSCFFMAPRDFLKFLSPSFFLSKETKPLFWHTSPNLKGRDPLMLVHTSSTGCFPLISSFPQQEDWVVSCWNSPSSSNVFLVCA